MSSPHPKIFKMWFEWVIENGNAKQVLGVRVDLELDRTDANFDFVKVQDVVRSAVASLAPRSYDPQSVIVRLVPKNGMDC